MRKKAEYSFFKLYSALFIIADIHSKPAGP